MNLYQKRKLINCEKEPFGRDRIFDDVTIEFIQLSSFKSIILKKFLIF